MTALRLERHRSAGCWVTWQKLEHQWSYLEEARTTEEMQPLTGRVEGRVLSPFFHPLLQFLTSASQTQQKTIDMVSWETDKGRPPSKTVQEGAMKWNVGMYLRTKGPIQT